MLAANVLVLAATSCSSDDSGGGGAKGDAAGPVSRPDLGKKWPLTSTADALVRELRRRRERHPHRPHGTKYALGGLAKSDDNLRDFNSNWG